MGQALCRGRHPRHAEAGRAANVRVYFAWEVLIKQSSELRICAGSLRWDRFDKERELCRASLCLEPVPELNVLAPTR